MKKLRKRLSDLETIEADDADVIVLSEEEEQKLIAVKYIFNQNLLIFISLKIFGKNKV